MSQDISRRITLFNGTTSHELTRVLSLSSVGAAVNGVDRGVFQVPNISFDFEITDAARIFLDGITDPAAVEVLVEEYHFFDPREYRPVFRGFLSKYPAETHTGTVDTAAAVADGKLSAYRDVLEVEDPRRGGPFQFEELGVLVRALLDAAGHPSKLIDVDVRRQNFDAEYWSFLFEPQKFRFDASAAYGTPYVKALAYDSARGVVYVGVDDWVGEVTVATLVCRKVGVVKYTGSDVALKAATWRVQYLEVDAAAGKLRGVAGTTETDVTEVVAHAHGEFEATPGTYCATLGFGSVYYLADDEKGYKRKSKLVNWMKDNAGNPSVSGVLSAESVGCGLFMKDKDIGVGHYRDYAWQLLAGPVARGATQIPVTIPWSICNAGNVPKVGDYCDLKAYATDHQQSLGRILKVENVKAATPYCLLTVEGAVNEPFTGTVYVYCYPGGSVCTDNLLWPAWGEIEVSYQETESLLWNKSSTGNLAGYKRLSVHVYRRWTGRDRPVEYFSTDAGEVDEGDQLVLDAGMFAFTASPELVAGYFPSPGMELRIGERPAPFYVKLPGYNLGAVLKADLRVEMAQPSDDPTVDYGPCYLAAAGVKVKWNDGTYVETYGKIFLCENENGKVFVVVNDHGWSNSAASKAYFKQVKWGYWDGSQVIKGGVDRAGDHWFDSPGYEVIGGIAAVGDTIVGGRRRVHKNWRKTGVQVVWAAPPQAGSLPTGFDGGYTASIIVPGDRTDVLKQNGVVRLGDTATAEADAKEYYVNEVSVVPRMLNDGFTLPAWAGTAAVYTLAHISEISRVDKALKGYEGAVAAEVLGRYLTVGEGWTKKVEVWKTYVTGYWELVSTYTRAIAEEEEGAAVEWAEEKAHGKKVTIAYDDGEARCPRVRLDGKNLIASTLTLTLTDGWRDLVVVDKSTSGVVPVPPPGTAYVKNGVGDNYDRCDVYFAPDVDGLDVVYNATYYGEDAITQVVRRGNEVYVAYEGDTRIYVVDAALAGAAYAGRVSAGDSRLRALVVGADGGMFALTDFTKAVVMLSTSWPQVVVGPVGGDHCDVAAVLGELARSYDCDFGEDAGVIIFRSKAGSRVVAMPRDVTDNVELVSEVRPDDYLAVDVRYDGGRARAGELLPTFEDSVFMLTAKYLTRNHEAAVIAERVMDFYRHNVRIVKAVLYPRDSLDAPTLGAGYVAGDFAGRLLRKSLAESDITVELEAGVDKNVVCYD